MHLLAKVRHSRQIFVEASQSFQISKRPCWLYYGLTASKSIQQFATMSKNDSICSNIQSGNTGRELNCGTHRISFSSMFAFTNRKDLKVLIPAVLLTIIAGAMKPAITIFLGQIFEDLASFGSGSITGDELLKSVSLWCTALTGLGVATMLVNGGFFGLWLIFGEMQAKTVRDRSFLCMLEKDMEWYDLREDGIGSLLVRIQT
jgi:hypothetical protein